MLERLKIKSKPVNARNEEPAKSKKSKFILLDEPNEINTAQDSLGSDDEIANYTNMLIKVDEKSDTLDFWKLYSNRFPILSVFAKKNLCIPASSTPLEEMFSKAGEVIDKTSWLSG